MLKLKDSAVNNVPHLRENYPAPETKQAESNGRLKIKQNRLAEIAPTLHTAETTAGSTTAGSRQATAEEDKPSFWERVGNTVAGGGKSYLAGASDTSGIRYQLGQGARSQVNADNVTIARKNYEQQLNELNAMLEENRITPGTYSDKEIEMQQGAVDWTKLQYDAYAGVDEVQKQAAQEARTEVSDALLLSGQQDIEEAKEGLGPLGQMAVDAGASLTQVALDMGTGALLGINPGAMLPFAYRAFGSGTQEARLDGADLEGQVLYGGLNAAKEVLLEKVSGIAFGKAYGGGSLDDATKAAVRKAVDTYAGTEAGQRLLGGVLTYGAGALGEGLEEAAAYIADLYLPMVYGKEAGEFDVSELLYDAGVGTLAGLAGVQSAFTYTPTAQTQNNGEDSGETVIDEKARAVFGRMGRQVMDAVMDNAKAQGMDDAEAYGAFARAYHQGSTGRKPQAVPGLTQEARELAYRAGREDAGEKAANEPTSSARSEGPEETGLVRDEYVNANIDAETADTLDTVAKALGLRVELSDELGNTGATGEILGNVVRIRKGTEDPVKQIYGHEITHRMQELAPEEYSVFRQIAATERGDYVQGIQELYRKNGVVLSYDAALDEVTADFAGTLIRDGEVLEQFIRDYRNKPTLLQRIRDAIRELVQKLTGKEKAQARSAEEALTAALEASSRTVEKEIRKNKNAAQQSDGGRYSIRYDQNNTPFVDVEEDILAGVPEREWVKTVKNNLREKFPEGVTVGNSKIKINAQTTSEITNSEYSKWLRDHSPAGYADKLRTTNNADEILLASRDYVGEGLKHSRKDNIKEFARGSVQLRIGGNDYTADVVVGTTKGNSMVLYDIVNIQSTIINEKKRVRTAATSKAGISDRTSVLANNSISKNPEKSNSKFAMAGTDEIVSNAQLRKQVESLQERLNYWKGQTRRTEKVTTDKKSVQKAARTLVKDLGADLDTKEVSGQLQELYDYMAQNGGAEGIRYEEVRSRAEAIATELVDNAVVVEDSLYQQYRDLRQYLKDTKIVVPEEATRDIPDFNDLRKSNFGRLNFSAKGAPNIDRVFSELSNMYPEFFNEDETTPASDQLMRIVDVAEELYRAREMNPFGGQEREAIQGVANEILEIFFDLPQTKATFADRQAAELAAQKAKDREKLERLREQKNQQIAGIRAENRRMTARRIEKERARREKEVTALRNKYAAKTAATRESQKAGELRRKITRHANDLSRKLLHPTDQQHIPESLRGAVAAVLQSINQESTFSVDPETGKHTTPGEGVNTKKTEAWRKLKEAYIEAAKDDSSAMVLDPDLFGAEAEGVQGLFDEVIGMGDTPIGKMNTEQLGKVWKLVRSIEHSITTAGRTLAGGKYERTADWANDFAEDAKHRRDKRSITRKHMLMDMEDPYTFFGHFGPSGKAIYRMLRDAQDKQAARTEELAGMVRRIADTKTIDALQKQRHTFTTERGDTLTLTTGQVMNLYNLSKRQQAQEHLLKGGITQPEIKRHGRQSGVRRDGTAVLLTAGDLQNILGVLTDEQKEIAQKLQKLTTTTLAGWGNEASMAAYGYKKFTEKNYWPIKSSKEQVHSTVEKGSGNPRSIKNIGMAKNVMPHASNALDIGDVFDVFAGHAADMLDYAAWLLPMEDANRLYNFQYRDSEGNPTGKTFKSILDRVGGAESQAYWARLMEDIQNGITPISDTAVTGGIDKIIGNSKGASVGANLRVVVQQPTAYLRANVVLGPGNLSKGLAGGVTKGSGWEKAKQWAPIAKIKDVGGFDQGNARSVGRQLYGVRTKLEATNDFFMKGAEAADHATWGKLWNACEWETKSRHKDLKPGSREFYQKTAEIFTDLIDQTQVVDGVLQRSQIMRSGNALNKQATSFMGEPTKSFNILLRSWDQWRYEEDTAKRSAAIKQAGRAAVALLVTDAMNALAQSMVDAMRDDDEDKDYWERFLSAFTGLEGDEESAWDKATAAVLQGNLAGNINPAGRIPYVKDVLSLLNGYNVTRMDADVIGDVLNAAKVFAQSAGGEGSRTRRYAVKELAHTVGKMFGISAGNILRDVWGFARSIAVGTGNVAVQYEMEKAIYNIDSTANKNRFIDIMYKAKNSGDQALYEHIYEELTAAGIEEKAIVSRMERNMKAEEGVDAVSDLAERYLTPAQDDVYAQLYAAVAQSDLWTAADADQRSYAEDLMYNVAANNAYGQKHMEKVEAGTDVGIDTADYLLYKLALEMCSDGDTNTSQAEAQAALGQLDLSRAEKAYLWQSTNKSWKPSNNPYSK